jgi:hypothetical protein
MNERELEPGTQLFFAAPAQPMPGIMEDAIAQVIAQVPGIFEAHLPECLIEGELDARQVLVIAVRRRREIPQIADILMGKLRLVLAVGQVLDILPFQVDELPPGVKEANCQIFAAKTKPWWNFWKRK